MLKPQDIVIVLHISNLGPNNWTQQQLAYELSLSQSEISQGLKRLVQCQLMSSPITGKSPTPIFPAIEEFLLHGFRYVFPAHTAGITRGLPTSYAAPIFKRHILSENDHPPVWPCAEGTQRGYSMTPLYKKLPDTIIKFNHQKLYDILAILDALRYGRVRERNIASKLLTKYIKETSHEFQSKEKH